MFLQHFHFFGRLWFDELITLWESVQNLPGWEVVSIFVYCKTSSVVGFSKFPFFGLFLHTYSTWSTSLLGWLMTTLATLIGTHIFLRFVVIYVLEVVCF